MKVDHKPTVHDIKSPRISRSAQIEKTFENVEGRKSGRNQVENLGNIMFKSKFIRVVCGICGSIFFRNAFN
jgi:hypothetical protein